MSSLFTSKLGTNYCPQDEEIVEIRAFLVEPTQRLKRLDDEISEVQKALDKLTEERVRLAAYVDAHRALISPVRRLPLDIIQEVFLACLPWHRNCVMSANEAPVLLGRVCSSWRTISLSTPRLWSKLHLALPGNQSHRLASFNSEAKMLQRLQTAETWLNRSGDCPLLISVQSPYDDPPPMTTPNFLHQYLIPFASRWEHISLTIPASVLAPWSHITTADVPRLKSVLIHIRRRFDPAEDETTQVAVLGFLRGPEICSVSLAGINFSPLQLPLRWNTLTEVSITGVGQMEPPFTSDIALELLSRCTALQTCRLAIHGHPDSGSGAVLEPTIVCAFLHTLDLWVSGLPSLTFHHLFSRLSPPELRDLTLSGYSDDPARISHTTGFLATAPCIESLNIDLHLFSESSLSEFFRGLPPTIQDLRITEYSSGESILLDDNLLVALISPPDLHGPYFSGLKQLEMRGCRSCSDEAVLQFIKTGISTRTLAASARVSISFSRPMQVDILPGLQPLMDMGLHIDLIYPPPPVWRVSPWQGLEDDPSTAPNDY
ncbi:hypothetical protein FB451DRAFT_1312988 [Mycena latifolia]|nr:hypothetical protein FB451DRAFT_1312988 [Mycena latifolia]